MVVPSQARARRRSLLALLLAALVGCSNQQQVVVDEERVARRVVALLRQQGLVVRGAPDGGRPPDEEGDADEEEAADTEEAEDPSRTDDSASTATADADAAADRARALAAAATRQAQASAAAAPNARRGARARPALPTTTSTPAVATGAGDSRRVWVPVADAPSLGPADAPVTIVAFVDPECPFCARLLPALLAAREAHPADVRLVVRLRPLAFHHGAWGASVLLELAKAQRGSEGFFAALSYLYADANQRSLDRASLDRHAAALGLDVLRLADALDAPNPTDLDRIIANDDAIAESVPVLGTPAMLFNGAYVSGAIPRERIEEILAFELRRARAALASGARRAALYDTLARTAAPGFANPQPRNRPLP
jgi:protein-disulfide isomerase